MIVPMPIDARPHATERAAARVSRRGAASGIDGPVILPVASPVTESDLENCAFAHLTGQGCSVFNLSIASMPA